MYKGFKIKPPFFEIGPKAYMTGETVLELAKAVDRFSKKYDVNVIFTPQFTDLPIIARETENLFVFAQYMDPIPVGRGQGKILPEAIKAAGCHGVMLNHTECQTTLNDLARAIEIADRLELGTVVCTDSVKEAKAVTHLEPNIIVCEPNDLIGTGVTADENYTLQTIKAIKDLNPDIFVLQGAGISNGQDVYNVIKLGAEATGTSSGCMKAPDPIAMAEEMISAVRRAWDEVHA